MKRLLVLTLLLIATYAHALSTKIPLTKLETHMWQSEDGLPQNNVQAILQSRTGYLWIGTQAGLVRFDGQRFKPVSDWPLDNVDITVLFEDRDGALWIGTNGGGIAIMRQDKFSRLTNVEGLFNPIIWNIRQTSDGAVWIATANGLYKYSAGKIHMFTEKDGLPNRLIWSILPDKKGNLWIGTQKGGVCIFENSRCEPVPALAEIKTAYALFEDREGYLWIGTQNEGLYRWKDNHLTVFGKEKGLEDTTVYGILQDKDGAIWISTFYGGIYRFFEEKFQTFTHAKGLPGTIAWPLLEDREGNVWAGIYNAGLLRFRDPASVRASTGRKSLPPHVLIESVLLDTKPLFSGQSVLAEQGNVQINYAVLSFTDPSKIQVYYRLNGFDKKWVASAGARTAYYTNLPSGKYTFFIRALSSDGVWSKNTASFDFQVKKHFYESYWFYFACLLITAGFVLFALRIKTSRLRKHQSELEDLVRLRTRQLEEAKEAAEAANKAKSRFIANVSHELRTPMNGIIGITELVLETSLDTNQKACLKVLKTSADNLLDLLNDLLDFSKIEAGKFTLLNSHFDVPNLVNDIVALFASRARHKGLELKINADDLTCRRVKGDAMRLRQILSNLLSNAIKFTERGCITVEVSQQSSATGNAAFVFSVSDTGIGIDATQHELIFNPFCQIDDSSTRQYGGTGLGLSIVNELVKLMHGRVRLESAPGKGSKFSFTAVFVSADEKNDLLEDKFNRTLPCENERQTENEYDAFLPDCDLESLKEIVQIFNRSVETEFEQFSTHVSVHETEMAAACLYKLKGTLSNFGSNRAFLIAAELESALKNCPDVVTPEVLIILKNGIDSLRASLERRIYESADCRG